VFSIMACSSLSTFSLNVSAVFCLSLLGVDVLGVALTILLASEFFGLEPVVTLLGF